MASKIRTTIKIAQEDRFQLQSLSLFQPINGHHSFELHCGLVETPDYLLDMAQQVIGEDIEITIHGGNPLDNRQHYFRGIVTNVGLSKQLNGNNEIVFQGYSPTIKLDDWPHQQSYTEQSLSDIIKDIMNRHGLDVKISGTNHSDPLAYDVQYQETSFNYTNRLANRYGEWFFFDGTDLHFGTPPKSEEIPLIFGRELFSFDLVLNARPSNFKAMGYDPIAHDFPDSQAASMSIEGLDDYGKLMADKSDKLFSHEATATIPQYIKDKSELDNLTAYRKQGNAAQYVIFEGTSDTHELKLGSIIGITGKRLGTNASASANYGTFRIIQISHSVDGSGSYQNRFRAISAELPSPPSYPAVRRPRAEVQPAEVMDNKDPEELGRIQVQFQWQKATGEMTPWIRVSASGAGGSHGAYFVPEIGDQLLVAFEYDNPNRPFALGSLYHGKAKPQGVADPDNYKKVIKTRSGNQIYLSDEGGKEEIKIENGTNVITLSLDGDTSISIVSTGDISLSAKNIALSAEENVNITCKKLSTTADQELSLSTDKFKVEAQTSAEIQAMQTAKLAGTTKTTIGDGAVASELKGTKVTVEGVAMTEVKGAMVKLN